MTDYVCVKEIVSGRGVVLFTKDTIYAFDDQMFVKDNLGAFRNEFHDNEKLMKEHFKLKEEELPWL
ncbi:hypothetical protein [Paenibacillus chitinolyticus]|uniref:hypothetical protein n=1 Tax=Paenibacillus chitinolyticus TaxID=79263 RepID=UPI003D06F539